MINGKNSKGLKNAIEKGLIIICAHGNLCLHLYFVVAFIAFYLNANIEKCKMI